VHDRLSAIVARIGLRAGGELRRAGGLGPREAGSPQAAARRGAPRIGSWAAWKGRSLRGRFSARSEGG
jgi:hypothetical protein